MRLTKLISWMLLCGTFAFLATAANGQQTSRTAGRIVAAKVRGTVVATSLADQSQRTLADNDTLTQQYVVTTGAGSSVILIFSNGATLNLGAESTLSIDEFLQDPFEKEIALSDLKEEPTTSTTKLNLSRGELVGNVKHLRADQGSTFTVNTPVGAAGIRGTTFRIVFRPDASGKVFFTLSTADGTVLFEAPAAEGVSVETGKEVVLNVEVEVDAETGKVTVTAPPTAQGVTDISAETQAIIATAAQEIVEASSAVIIVASQKAADEKAAADKAAAEKAEQEKKAAEKEAADKKAAEDKAVADKAAADKAAADKAAADKAAADKKAIPDPTTPPSNTTPGDGL